MSQDVEVLLTPRGHEKLEQRLNHLQNVSRRDVAERIRDSKQFGDLAENAEYDDAKTEQALIESQITDLRRVLSVARLLDPTDIPTEEVGIGSIVAITNVENDDAWEATLVGPFEADPDNDLISDESPLGEALMGHKVGDVVSVEVPDGVLKYRIDSIRK